MPLTRYLTIIQKIFVEGLLNVTQYLGLEQSPASWNSILVWETDNEQTNTESGTIKFGEEKEKITG